MRLLKLVNDNNFELREFSEDHVPRYAALSHTWRLDGREVSFNDVSQGTAQQKPAFRKLKFAAEQAMRDGLQYVWIDTCCIDKTSSAELQEAIIFMFKWFQKSTVTYVYLEDVFMASDTKAQGNSSPELPNVVQNDFRRCRWFTRGWTLQELLAPSNLEFFSAEGTYLGSKASLLEQVHQITKIPREALKGEPLSSFNVEERWSWAAHRLTTRREDAAYCLFGLFDVFMPILYGEGGDHALKRLKEEIERKYRPDEVEIYLQDLTEEPVVHGNITEGIIASQAKPPIGSTSTDGSEISIDSEIDSIFSAEGSTTSSVSVSSRGDIQAAGIREATRALLEHPELQSLFRNIIRKIERQKARRHIRGFLKAYGHDLIRETKGINTYYEAATFVCQLPGRMADEVIWRFAPIEAQRRPEETEQSKLNLESWLSTITPGDGGAGIEHTDQREVDEWDNDDTEIPPFPHIDSVKGFLLQSEAFAMLLASVKTWLKVDDGTQTADGRLGIDAIDEAEQARGLLELESEAGNNRIEKSPVENADLDDGDSFSRYPDLLSDSDSSGDFLVLLWNRFTDCVDSWCNGLLGVDPGYSLPSLCPPQHKRLEWVCSCGSTLRADVPVMDQNIVHELEKDLSADTKSVSLTEPGPTNSRSPSTPSTDQSSSALTGQQSFRTVAQRSLEQKSPSNAPGSHMNATNTASDQLNGAHVVQLGLLPTYFEMCVNIGKFAIEHIEADISNVTTDKELFRIIWHKYNNCRSKDVRRLFLRPRNIHFVMFATHRRRPQETGIHKKPNEYPPIIELDEKRYHYLCPKFRMPVNIFLHYLYKAGQHSAEDHNENIWLRRLPKKINKSVLIDARHGFHNHDPEDQLDMNDPDLAIGWGVHILDGPNHAVLWTLLTLGIVIAFVVSVLIVGLARTQEQGFGVGSFLLTVMAAIWAATYSHLQDI